MRAFSRFTAAGCFTLLAASWTLGADAIRWEPDFETAMQKAAQQNRLVLVHFWNDGCPPCVMVDRQVFPSPQVGEAVHASYVPVKVHAGQRADLARRYGVEQWPTDVFLSPDGHRVAAYISPKTPQDYSEMVTHIASREQPRLGGPATQLAQAGPMGQPAGRMPQGDRSSTFPMGGPSNASRGSYEVQAGGEFPLGNQAATTPPPQNDFTSPYRPAGNPAQQPFPPQQPMNTAPPLVNPFSQNASPYGGAGVQGAPGVPQNQASSAWPPSNTGAMNPQSNLPGTPQGGLGNPALNRNSGWPPGNSSATGLSTPSNAPAPVSQSQVNSPFNGDSSYQRPAVSQPAQSPSMGIPSAAPQLAAGPQVALQQPAAGQQGAPQQAPPSGPKFALDGYCVVSLVEQLHLPPEQQQWRKGDPRFGAVHRGQTYLFTGQAEQQKFLANPDYYTPFLSGFDPVTFVEQGSLIEGRREHGFTHDGRIYIFSTEQNLQKFWSSRDMFISRVQQAMNTPAGQQRR